MCAARLRSGQWHFKSSGATGSQRGMLDRAGLDLGRVEGESISGRGGEELVVEIHSDDAGG